MINPSVSGWIDKFFREQDFLSQNPITEESSFYNSVRDTGFIYGHIIRLDTPNSIETEGWLKEEMSKVALLATLFGVYRLTRKNNSVEIFMSEVILFYNEIHPEEFNLFKPFLPKESLSVLLEKIIEERTKTNESVFNKTFSHLVTNGLLFIDILAFRHYLIHKITPEKYFKKIEETIVDLITMALRIKTHKTEYDDLLIKLIESSIRYSKFSDNQDLSIEKLRLNYLNSDLEKRYLIDIAGMALWNDTLIKENESHFIYKLAETIAIPPNITEQSVVSITDFIIKNKEEIPFFNYSHPIKHFYNHTTETIATLILRNKGRLINELNQSKELMQLIARSANHDLTEKEKKKVKKQLLDICKTIPSLTIFLLPGGSLLLPILIKFIPQLLPSSFNENLKEDN